MSVKNKIIILVIVCVTILIGAIVADKIMSKSYFNEIKYEELVKKIENKESFVVLISQTTCTHCISYKPKLESVANEYKIEVYYIDVDLLSEEQEKILKTYISYSSTPSTVFIKNGEETSAATRINGDVQMRDTIIKKFKSNGFIN